MKMTILRKNRKSKAQIISVLTLMALGLTCILQLGYHRQDTHVQEYMKDSGHGRQLLQDDRGGVDNDNDNNNDNDNPRDDNNNDDRRGDNEDDRDGSTQALNCTPRSINQFPPDFFSPEQRQNGGVAFHILLSIYIFCALAVVCDDYFVSSLEKICEVLNLQADVAGATFMAAGSSAPELFTSIIGVFLAKSDVGIGTIVGSAVFNILFIIALCGLGGGMVIYLTWWPMFRDCIYYMLSVIVLVIVIYDEEVHWYEALVMFLLYIVYIVFMYFNRPVGDYFIHKVNVWKRDHSCCRNISRMHAEKKEKDLADERTKLLGKNESPSGGRMPRSESTRSIPEVQKQLAQGGLVRERKSSIRRSISESPPKDAQYIDYHVSSVDLEHGDYESPLTFPETILGRFWWCLMLPVTLVFFLTIPDCRRPGIWGRFFIGTFVMSIVWIAGLSYVMVWMVTIAGDTLGVPDTVMGLTILAAGTSVPDALSSLFVARDGYGDMAVANSIGSNVFDILLCLGLPWLLQTTVFDFNGVVTINSASLPFVSITLLATVVFLFSAMLLNGWKLNKKFGVLCLFVYAVVITIACLFEMNVFGQINLPACPRNLILDS